MLISIILGLQSTTFQPNHFLMAHYLEYISVKGYAKIISGNQMPGIKESIDKPIPLKGVKVVAVSGPVKTINGQPRILLNQISSSIIETSTNKNGIFKFSLKPGFYTFFLVDGDRAYLNSFDGNGFFKGTKLTQPINDLLLIDDQNAIY